MKKAVVRSSIFEPLASGGSAAPPEAISMNYGMTPNDDAASRSDRWSTTSTDRPASNFKVYYSLQAPADVAPCHDTMPGIGGWVCRID